MPLPTLTFFSEKLNQFSISYLQVTYFPRATISRPVVQHTSSLRTFFLLVSISFYLQTHLHTLTIYASLTSASLSLLYSMYFSPRTEPQCEPPKQCNARVTAATLCNPQMEKNTVCFSFLKHILPSSICILLPFSRSIARNILHFILHFRPYRSWSIFTNT